MPPPILLSCQGISKSFGSRPLFEGLTFAVHEGDHIGLVGPNGAGKSTLLKILAGVEVPDEGACTRRKNLRVGYVPQHPAFAPGMTVAADRRGVDRRHLAARPHEKDQRVAVALSKVGFADPCLAADTLSGGWRTRLAIARALAADPEVLLLDEPTNHLDLESRLWLESLLTGSPEAFVVVSHDRYFLQNIGRRMFEIDRVYAEGLDHRRRLVRGSARKARSRSCPTRRATKSRSQIACAARSRGCAAAPRRARENPRPASTPRIRGSTSSRKAGTGASWRSAGIELAATGRRTKRLWHGVGLTKRFGSIAIVEGLELLLTPGMRLGVLGPNGSGKTTLLRMIVGELPPDAGEIHPAEALRVVYFDQNRATLDPALSLKRSLAPDGDTVVYRDRAVHVASWAKRFLFRPEQLETPVSRLSGGERARIVLARLMLQPADLLVLDEPTNDLDIPTLEVLEESLLEFPGALVLVTHDRHLIDRVSTTILALDGRGGAERFADYGQWEAERGHARSVDEGCRATGGREGAEGVRPRSSPTSSSASGTAWRTSVLAAEARLEEARSRRRTTRRSQATRRRFSSGSRSWTPRSTRSTGSTRGGRSWKRSGNEGRSGTRHSGRVTPKLFVPSEPTPAGQAFCARLR